MTDQSWSDFAKEGARLYSKRKSKIDGSEEPFVYFAFNFDDPKATFSQAIRDYSQWHRNTVDTARREKRNCAFMRGVVFTIDEGLGYSANVIFGIFLKTIQSGT